LCSLSLVIEYEPKGCFKEARSKRKRIFPKIFGVVKNVDFGNPDVQQIFSECKQLAENEGYEIFAIQVNSMLVQIIFKNLGDEPVIKWFKTSNFKKSLLEILST